MTVRAINDSGVCCGYWSASLHSPAHALLLSESGITNVESRVGHDCDILDLNNRGQLLCSPFQGKSLRSFILTGHRKRWIGTLGGKDCTARRINTNGDVVGWADRKDGQSHAFLYADRRMVDLGTLGGDSSDANSINDKRQVAGTSLTANHRGHAFLWQSGQMFDLGSLGGAITSVSSINNCGEVVGMSEKPMDRNRDNLERYHAAMWRNGTIVELETLNCEMSEARAINDNHVVVGAITILDGGPRRYGMRAFVWYEGKMYSLNDLLPAGSGVVLTDAVAINRFNQVVAYAGEMPVLLQLQLPGSPP